ncbi:nostrin [Daktulosphaira vitifoliae]|uniref:nostrin n=1 Tax=Daktulosphaira vitifoliae TaxID=58002 RepID=UPI0021AAB25F|nr:nostrin [Daktulosphaira vitifoliae]XP_050531763.1 nostrin [Daktulosphaira vitifoliae]
MDSNTKTLSSAKKSRLRYTIRGGFEFDTMGKTRYHELRKYVKKGNDFCKELANIMQERVEVEMHYAKTLSKLSAKLVKVAKNGVGSVQNAWMHIGKEMEADGQVHRCFANTLEEDIVKPLKNLQDTQYKIKKTVECDVTKTKKNMNEWRSAERKSKKQSFSVARENEKMQDTVADVTTYSIVTSNCNINKDATKLESKKRKLEESVKKSYTEYYTYCVRTARAKLDWEMSVSNGENSFMTMEEERLLRLKEYAHHMLQSYQKIGPKISQISMRLSEPVTECDVPKDFSIIADSVNKYEDEDLSVQVLPDFYPEHTHLAMNKRRRISALTKILQLINQDLERERRSKQGLDTLSNAMHNSTSFKQDDSYKNVNEKLHHTNLMILYLEAVKYKVVTALDVLEGRLPTTSNALSQHIQTSRDKNGYQHSVLKMPSTVCLKLSSAPEESIHNGPTWSDRGSADGTDIDDFSSDEDNSVDVSSPRCKAIYPYTAKLNDELNLEPGDIIRVHSKKSDGWWYGELEGTTGVFPATYVVEID